MLTSIHSDELASTSFMLIERSAFIHFEGLVLLKFNCFSVV